MAYNTLTISGLATFSSSTASNTDRMMVGVGNTTYGVARPFAYQMATFISGALPAAATYPQCIISVSGSGPVWSNGTAWISFSSGAVVT